MLDRPRRASLLTAQTRTALRHIYPTAVPRNPEAKAVATLAMGESETRLEPRRPELDLLCSPMDSAAGTRPPVLRGLDYTGTHPAAQHELGGIDVAFEDDRITLTRGRELLGSIEWPDIKGLAAYSETTKGRVGFLSVFFFGVFAFLFKRRERRVLLRIEDRSGDWLFEVSGIKLNELRSGLAEIRRRHGL